VPGVRELGGDPEYAALDPSAKRIAFDRIAAGDREFQQLDPEARGIVRSRLVSVTAVAPTAPPPAPSAPSPAAASQTPLLQAGAERQQRALQATQGLLPGLGQILSPVAGTDVLGGIGKVLGALGGAGTYIGAPLGGMAGEGLRRVGVPPVVQEIGAQIAEQIPTLGLARGLQTAGQIPTAARALAETVGVPTFPAARPVSIPRRAVAEAPMPEAPAPRPSIEAPIPRPEAQRAVVGAGPEYAGAAPVMRPPPPPTGAPSVRVAWDTRPPTKAGETIVRVPIDDLLEAAKESAATPGRFRQRVGDTDKLKRARQFFVESEAAGTPIRVPEIHFDDAGKLNIGDGLHRATVAKELGYRTIPVRIQSSELGELEQTGLRFQPVESYNLPDAGRAATPGGLAGTGREVAGAERRPAGAGDAGISGVPPESLGERAPGGERPALELTGAPEVGRARAPKGIPLTADAKRAELAQIKQEARPKGFTAETDIPDELHRRLAARRNLDGLREDLGHMEGQVGRYRSGEGQTEAWYGVKSTLPKQLQQGKSYSEIRRIIEKGLTGEKLPPGQARYWSKLEQWAYRKDGPLSEGDLHEFTAEHGLPPPATAVDEVALEHEAILGERAGQIPPTPRDLEFGPFPAEAAALRKSEVAAPESLGGIRAETDRAEAVPIPRAQQAAPTPETPGFTAIEGGRAGGGPPQTPPPPEGLPKYAGSVNLERIKTDDDVKRAILEASQQIPKREAITEGAILDKANALGFDLKDSEKFHAQTVAQRAKFLATRDVHVALQERHVEAAKAFAENPTPENWTRANDALAASLRGFKAAQGVASEAGLALRTFAMGSRANITDAARARINQLLTVIERKGKLSDEVTQRIHDVVATRGLESPERVNDLLQYLMPKTATLQDKVYEFWVSSILSGPITHMANTVGNTLNLIGRPIGSVTSAAGSAVKAAVTGAARQRFFGEATADLVGMVGGVRDAMRAFARTARRGYSEQPGKLFEISSRGPAIEGVKGRIIRTPLALLAAEDDAMKVFARRGARWQMAYRLAAKEGKTGDALKKRVAQFVSQPPVEITAYEEGEALYRTFQRRLGKFGQAVLNLRQADPTGLVRFIAPFVTTPINIAKVAFSPKVAVGNLIAAGVATYVLDGEITSGGPADPERRKALLATGWQPYSFKVGDTYYSYRRIEPLATSLGTVADAIELMKERPQDEQQWKNFAKQAASAVTKNLTDKSFLRGIDEFTDFLHDPGRFGEKFIGSLLGGFVPGAVATVARAADPYLRQPDTIAERVKERIPGLREQLPPKRDIRGKPVPAIGTPLERAISPVPTSKERGGPIEKLIVELEGEIGDVRRTIQKSGKKIVLEGGDYDRLKEVTGEQVDKRLDRLEARLPMLMRFPRERQLEKVKAAIQEGRSAGRAIFLREFAAKKRRSA